MAKYVTYTVQIPIEEGGELAKKIEAVAKRNGLSVESIVDTAVQLGIYGHIEGNLATLERAAPLNRDI